MVLFFLRFCFFIILIGRLYPLGDQVKQFVISSDDLNYESKNFKRIQEDFNLESEKTLIVDFGQRKNTPDSFGYNKEKALCKIPQNVKKIVIKGRSLQSIGDMFLFSCKYIQEVVIESPIKEIQSDFLSENVSLVHLKLPDTLERVENSFLDGCGALSTIEIPKYIQEVGDNFLRDCASLVRLKMPESLVKIGHNFMQRCSKIKALYMPEHIKDVKDNFLESADELKIIELPKKLEKIGNNFLKNCQKLKTVKIPDGVTEVGRDFLFGDKDLQMLYLPNILVTIPEGFLVGCYSLKSIKITYGSPAFIFLVSLVKIDQEIKQLILANK